MAPNALRDEALWAEIAAAGPRPSAFLGSELSDSDDEVRAEHARRRSFIARFAYAAPTPEAVHELARFLDAHRTLEVGAGLGLWARLLRDEGVSIAATDVAPMLEQSFIDVTRLDAAAAVVTHPECDALLLVWPPHKQAMAYRALRCFRGERLACVGDPQFIGDGAFQEEVAKGWTLEGKVSLPSWPGLIDSVRVYRRFQAQRHPRHSI